VKKFLRYLDPEGWFRPSVGPPKRRFRGSMLLLAGVELIFFIVATMKLCFRFVLETVLIIQGCFSCC